MIDMYQTTIHLHPAVIRWIDANFKKKDEIYDIRKDPLYLLIQSGLMRKNIKIPHKKTLKKTFIPVRFMINEWDFYHFGWVIPSGTQVKINNYLYKSMLYQFCRDIAFGYVFGNIPRDVMVRRILIENLFNDDELNYYNLRKFYSRHYKEKEKELVELKRITQYTMTQE